jgi:rhamnosyltransferase
MVENVPENPDQALKTALKSALVLPTLNAGADFVVWLDALRMQTFHPTRLLLIDSSSTDSTAGMAREFGFEVRTIDRTAFSHGGTRRESVDLLTDSDIVIFLTQDAFLASPDALAKLIKWFEDPRVGAVYGRQLPRRGARPIEAHARLYNYPRESCVKTRDDIPQLGLKTSFISNSFAAWRRTALEEAGGFPTHTIQNEDAWVASRMILSGWKVVYAADAEVYHSHPLTWGQEFRRYFDIGVFHARDPWIRSQFGEAGGEGLRFVRSELHYLRRKQPAAILSAMIRTGLKLIGYKLGHMERRLPYGLKRRLSGNKQYWDQINLQQGSGA